MTKPQRAPKVRVKGFGFAWRIVNHAGSLGGTLSCSLHAPAHASSPFPHHFVQNLFATSWVWIKRFVRTGVWQELHHSAQVHLAVSYVLSYPVLFAAQCQRLDTRACLHCPCSSHNGDRLSCVAPGGQACTTFYKVRPPRIALGSCLLPVPHILHRLVSLPPKWPLGFPQGLGVTVPMCDSLAHGPQDSASTCYVNVTAPAGSAYADTQFMLRFNRRDAPLGDWPICPGGGAGCQLVVSLRLPSIRFH